MNYIFLAVGITGLIITTVLSLMGKMTLSQRAQALLPRWADWIVGLGGCGLLCYLQQHLYLNTHLFGYWLLFWGHIWIANRERW